MGSQAWSASGVQHGRLSRHPGTTPDLAASWTGRSAPLGASSIVVWAGRLRPPRVYADLSRNPASRGADTAIRTPGLVFFGHSRHSRPARQPSNDPGDHPRPYRGLWVRRVWEGAGIRMIAKAPQARRDRRMRGSPRNGSVATTSAGMLTWRAGSVSTISAVRSSPLSSNAAMRSASHGNYLLEVTFPANYRKMENMMFDRLIGAV